MTLRARLVIASTVAVAIAVLLASGASWLFARNALVASTDDVLRQAAATAQARPFIDPNESAGTAIQVVDASGTAILSPPGGSIPVDEDVRSVASGQTESTIETIVIDKQSFRQLIEPLGPGQVVRSGGNQAIGSPEGQILTSTGALQIVVPLAGVNHQLKHLESVLLFVASGGVIIAILLSLLVARTALAPLDNVTAVIEDLAETTDMTKRLDEGGVDELGRLRRAFNRLLAALERSQNQQRQLVQDASHELRTPLTSLRTNTEVLRRFEDLDAESKEQLVDDVLTQLGELTTTVGDLAELARGEHQVAEPTRFRLDQLIDDLVAVAATHGRTRDIEITANLDECWVHARRDRLARAIGNLIDNALKFSPDSSTVEVSVSQGIVTVRDHGPGIAEDDLLQVFERFYRSPQARALPGSGLGLAIVAQVATEEGGTVAASNAPDGGAILRLDLPTVS